jgi:hypothetical protein
LSTPPGDFAGIGSSPGQSWANVTFFDYAFHRRFSATRLSGCVERSVDRWAGGGEMLEISQACRSPVSVEPRYQASVVAADARKVGLERLRGSISLAMGLHRGGPPLHAILPEGVSWAAGGLAVRGPHPCSATAPECSSLQSRKSLLSKGPLPGEELAQEVKGRSVPAAASPVAWPASLVGRAEPCPTGYRGPDLHPCMLQTGEQKSVARIVQLARRC